MKKASTLAACSLLSVSMAASMFAGCGEQKVDGTQTAMVIDGEEVSVGLANYLLRTEQAKTYMQMQGMMQYFSQDGKSMWSTEGEDGLTYGESFKTSETEQLTRLLALRKHAEEYGITVTEEEEQKIADAAKAFCDKNAEAVAKMGTSPENVAEALELKTYEIKMRAPMIEDTDRNVSDEEAAQTTCTYVRLKKPDDAADTEAVKETMQGILDEILALDKPAAADLSEICKAADEETYSAQYHFNQDDYSDENNVLDAAVKEVLPDLKEGEVYDQVIEGESYYFIVRMDHYFDKEKTEAQKESIISERENAKYEEILSGWTEGITPETKSAWDNLLVTDDEIYTVAS